MWGNMISSGGLRAEGGLWGAERAKWVRWEAYRGDFVLCYGFFIYLSEVLSRSFYEV